MELEEDFTQSIQSKSEIKESTNKPREDNKPFQFSLKNFKIIKK